MLLLEKQKLDVLQDHVGSGLCVSLQDKLEKASGTSVLAVLEAPAVFRDIRGRQTWQACGSRLALLPFLLSAPKLMLLLVSGIQGP